jgi:epoxyqueuosine reductase QueG
VCPWNASSPRSDDPAWQPRPLWDGVSLDVLAAAGDDELSASLDGSAMQRAGIRGLRRNVGVAVDNDRARHKSSPV